MMKYKSYAKIKSGQDGASFGNLLFRFGSRGNCSVYDLSCAKACGEELVPVAEFLLDRAEEIAPHSNAVMFGKEYYAEGDEFPLLYSNIYNNYKNSDDKLVGVLCVYRIFREGEGFSSSLVGLIEIGFTADRSLWRSGGDVEDVRPYGNFVLDNESGRLYAFVMRDGEKTVRYFSFDTPDVRCGAICKRFGVPRVVLGSSDIKEYFDVPYHNYVQGATLRAGKIYSLEGFGEKIHPALRVIDLAQRKQTAFIDLYDLGLTDEAELIDFYGDICLYSDAHGDVFELIKIE